MGLFRRAEWHSGLTYRQTCRECKTTIEYTDKSLDFRPWYPDGFVYCPKCKKPLRHNENLAITEAKPEHVVLDEAPVQKPAEEGVFCTNCGKKLNEDDKFCANCGTKR